MSMAPATTPRDQVERAAVAGGLDSLMRVLSRARQLRRPPVQAALWHQVQRGALDYAGLAAATGALAGFLTIATVGIGFGLGVATAVRLMQALVLGQFAGFACALLVSAGPGTAATFELGLMRQQGELRTLQLMGIDPRDYLVLPRVLGFALALFVLAFVFQLASVLGGFALVALATEVSFTQQFGALVDSLRPAALVLSGVRSLMLGAIIGTLVCDYGLVKPFSPTDMPQISRRLLSRSLIALVLVHGAMALVLS